MKSDDLRALFAELRRLKQTELPRAEAMEPMRAVKIAAVAIVSGAVAALMLHALRLAVWSAAIIVAVLTRGGC